MLNKSTCVKLVLDTRERVYMLRIVRYVHRRTKHGIYETHIAHDRRACLRIVGVEDVEADSESHMTDSRDFYTAFDHVMDWKAFDAAVAERREAKIAEQQALDPSYIAPTERCKHTLNLFR